MAGPSDKGSESSERALLGRLFAADGLGAEEFRDAADPHTQAFFGELEDGSMVDHYRIGAPLGRGGAGAVYRAHDIRLDRDVAIKVIVADAGESQRQRKRFLQEALAVSQLRHRHVVALHSNGTWRGWPYVVLQLVEGGTLQDRLDDAGPLAVKEAAEITRKLASALAAAHASEILHSDVKPSNVLLDRAGEPLLTDFGLVKRTDLSLSSTHLTRTGVFLGTPGYCPPEQAFGRLEDVGPPSDVYGLGGTLYAMLTGRPPHAGQTPADRLNPAKGVVKTPSELRVDVDPDLEAICLRCLESEPRDRYASAKELGDVLGAYLHRAPAASERSDRRGLYALAAVALLAVGAAWIAQTDSDRADVAPSPELAGRTPPTPPETEGPKDDAGATDADTEALAALPAEKAGAVGDAAVAKLTEALRLDPKDHQARRARARALEEAGDLSAALDDLTTLLKDAPTASRYNARSRLRWTAGDAQGAEDDASEAIRLEPENWKVYELRGFIREMRKENLIGALADYDAAVKYGATEVDLFFLRAGVRLKLGDDRGAIDDYDRALKLRPDAGQLRNRGECKLHLGDLSGAVDDFGRAIELSPDGSFFAKRGLAKELQGDAEGARQDYQQASKRYAADSKEAPRAVVDALRRLARPREEPGVADAALASVAVCRGRAKEAGGDAKAALALFNEALRIDPANQDARRARAEAHAQGGNLPAALDDLTTLVEAAPSALHYERRSRVRLNAGDLRGAEDDASELIRSLPEDWRFRKLRGKIRERRSNLTGALADYDAAVTYGASDAATFFLRAGLRGRRGDHRGAIEDYDRGLKRGPHAEMLFNRGGSKLRLGNQKGAIDDFSRAIELRPDGFFFMKRARVKELQGDARGARGDYEQALKLPTTFEGVEGVSGWRGEVAEALDRLPPSPAPSER